MTTPPEATSPTQSVITELLEALKASAAAHEKLLRAWMYTPFPKEAQVLGGMSPPVGPIADAVTDVRCARAAIAKAEAALAVSTRDSLTCDLCGGSGVLAALDHSVSAPCLCQTKGAVPPASDGWQLDPTPAQIKAIEFAIYRYANCPARDAERAAPHVYRAVVVASLPQPNPKPNNLPEGEG